MAKLSLLDAAASSAGTGGTEHDRQAADAGYRSFTYTVSPRELTREGATLFIGPSLPPIEYRELADGTRILAQESPFDPAQQREILGGIRGHIRSLFDSVSESINRQYFDLRADDISAFARTPDDALILERELTRDMVNFFKNLSQRLSVDTYEQDKQLHWELLTLNFAVNALSTAIMHPETGELPSSGIDSYVQEVDKRFRSLSQPLREAFAARDLAFYATAATLEEAAPDQAMLVLQALREETPLETAVEKPREQSALPVEQAPGQTVINDPFSREERRIGYQPMPESRFEGAIETSNHSFFGRLFVTEVRDITPSGGLRNAVTSLAPHQTADLNQAGDRQSHQADITFPVADLEREGFIALPIPLGCTVTHMDTPCELYRSNAGTFMIRHIPEGTESIRYRIEGCQQGDSVVPDRDAWTQSYPVPHTRSETAIADTIIRAAAGAKRKGELILGALASVSPDYSTEPFLGEIYDRAGTDTYMAYEAMQIYQCAGGTLYLANRFRGHDIPALYIGGFCPDSNRRQFDVARGHAQLAFWDEDGQILFAESTAPTNSHRTLDFATVTGGERESLLSDVETLASNALFTRLRRFSSLLKSDHARDEYNQERNRQGFYPDTQLTVQSAAISEDHDAGNYFSGVSFAKKFASLEVQEMTSEELIALLAGAARVYWHGIESWADRNLTGDDLAEAQRISALPWTRLLRQATNGYLASPIPTDEDKASVKKWLQTRALSGSGWGSSSSPFDAFETFDLLGPDTLLGLSTSELAQACRISISRSGAWGQGAEQVPEHFMRGVRIAEELSSEVLRRAATEEFPPWLDFDPRQDPNDSIFHKLHWRCREYPDDPTLPHVLRTFANLFETISNGPQQLMQDLVFTWDGNETMAAQTDFGPVFKKLGELGLLPHIVDAEGRPTERFEAELADHIVSAFWLQTEGARAVITDDTITALRSLGFEPARMFTSERLEAALETFGDYLQINLSGPGDEDRYPCSTLLLENASHSRYDLPSLNTARNIMKLAEISGTPLADARARVPECDETEVFERFLKAGEIRVLSGGLSLGWSRGDPSRNDTLTFDIPFEPPEHLIAAAARERTRPLIQSLYTLPQVGGDTVLEAGRRTRSILERIDERTGGAFGAALGSPGDDQLTVMATERASRVFITGQNRYSAGAAFGCVLGLPNDHQDRWASHSALCGFIGAVAALDSDLARDADLLGSTIEGLQGDLSATAAGRAFIELFGTIPPVQQYAVCCAVQDRFDSQPGTGGNTPFMGGFGSRRDAWLPAAFRFDYTESMLANYVSGSSGFIGRPSDPAADVWYRAIKRSFARDPRTVPDSEINDCLVRSYSDSVRLRPRLNSPSAFAIAADLFGLPPRKGSGDDFIGLREYAPGDRMRDIHWKKSTGGKMFVKEYGSEQTDPVHVMVDLAWLMPSSAACSDPAAPALSENFATFVSVFYRAQQLRVPASCTLCFRGEVLADFDSRIMGSVFDIRSRDTAQKLLSEIGNLALRTRLLVDFEGAGGIGGPQPDAEQPAVVIPRNRSLVGLFRPEELAHYSTALAIHEQRGNTVLVSP